MSHIQRCCHSRRRSSEQAASPQAESPSSIPLVVNSMVCMLRVWSEEEWAELPEADRPIEYVHAPGMGWVGAVPIEGMN